VVRRETEAEDHGLSESLLDRDGYGHDLGGAVGAGLAVGLRTGGETRRIAALVMLCVLYSWAVTMVALPIVRLMSPALGLVFPFGALALASLWHKVGARRQRTADLSIERP